mmetsp:Transcript_13442/g.38032  ORF Transcript_13442/g.38032 Transcript_13442/m.38032 type:complete len:223 (-) Transcript_13442:730-1398(-)
MPHTLTAPRPPAPPVVGAALSSLFSSLLLLSSPPTSPAWARGVGGSSLASSASTTGRCRYRSVCMMCRASSTELSRRTVSGFGVMHVPTDVLAGSSPLPTTRAITSLQVRMPTNRWCASRSSTLWLYGSRPSPSPSNTRTAVMRASFIASAASCTEAFTSSLSRLLRCTTVPTVGEIESISALSVRCASSSVSAVSKSPPICCARCTACRKPAWFACMRSIL